MTVGRPVLLASIAVVLSFPTISQRVTQNPTLQSLKDCPCYTPRLLPQILGALCSYICCACLNGEAKWLLATGGINECFNLHASWSRMVERD